MRDPVEHPMADDGTRNPHRSSAQPCAKNIQRREHRRPDDCHQQAVRVRIAVEGERCERRVPGIDAHALPAEDEKDRPQEIERLRRGDQHAERRARGDAFEREADGEVADEHQGLAGLARRTPICSSSPVKS